MTIKHRFDTRSYKSLIIFGWLVCWKLARSFLISSKFYVLRSFGSGFLSRIFHFKRLRTLNVFYCTLNHVLRIFESFAFSTYCCEFCESSDLRAFSSAFLLPFRRFDSTRFRRFDSTRFRRFDLTTFDDSTRFCSTIWFDSFFDWFLRFD